MKHIIRIVVVTLAIMLIVYGCTYTSITTSLNHTSATLTKHGEYEAILPLQTCGDYFIADVMLNGFGPFPMMLDSGMGVTIISPHVVGKTGVKRRINTIEIGDFLATGRIPCRVKSLDDISRALGLDIEGILGHGVFKGVLLTYDYPQMEVRVREGMLNDDEPGVVPTSKGKRPFIAAHIDGRDITILADTGSSRGLTLIDLDQYRFVVEPRFTGARVRINGVSIVRTGRLDSVMTLGPLKLNEPLINNSVSVNLLGQDILRNFAITFDQVQHRMKFASMQDIDDEHGTKSIADVIEFPSLYGSGIIMIPDGDQYVIHDVAAHSPADEAGLRVGDVILAIDGIRIDDRGCDHFNQRDDIPASVTYVVQRDGETHEVMITTTVIVP